MTNQNKENNLNGESLIESYSINYVPEKHRHGSPKDLFTLWFCTNLAPLAVITGAMSILVFNLDIISSLSAIVCGHFFGSIILALTSAQGPQVGTPQMIQSRAQFGRYGSLLVVLFTTLIYLGYFISNIILSGKTLNTVLPFIPINLATIIGALLATLMGIIGYKFIHLFNKIGTYLMGSSLLIAFIIILINFNIDLLNKGDFNLACWFSMFGLCSVWQISYSPYTSDYSRYLPKQIGILKPFLFTYFGASLGTIFAFTFGMLAVSISNYNDAMEAVKYQTGLFGHILIILFLINIIGHNSINLYGAVLSFITFIQTFYYNWIPKKREKIIFSLLILLSSTYCALLASSNFINIFINTVFALLFTLTPWVAINLIDFYIINKQNYDINSLFDNNGGKYKKINFKTLVIYFLGILIQLPFIENFMFKGFWADSFNGVDISWLLGLIFTGFIYYIFSIKNI